MHRLWWRLKITKDSTTPHEIFLKSVYRKHLRKIQWIAMLELLKSKKKTTVKLNNSDNKKTVGSGRGRWNEVILWLVSKSPRETGWYPEYRFSKAVFNYVFWKNQSLLTVLKIFTYRNVHKANLPYDGFKCYNIRDFSLVKLSWRKSKLHTFPQRLSLLTNPREKIKIKWSLPCPFFQNLVVLSV